MGALSEFVKRKFGVETRHIQDPVTDVCKTTITDLLLNNPDRLAYILVNLGTTSMYVAWDPSVSASHGIYVAPNGGSFSLTADEDGELVGYALYGIAITSDNDIFTVTVEAA